MRADNNVIHITDALPVKQKQSASYADKLLTTGDGVVFVVKDRVDLEEFTTDMWYALLVPKGKVLAFKADVASKAPLKVKQFGKIIARSGAPLTSQQVANALYDHGLRAA